MGLFSKKIDSDQEDDEIKDIDIPKKKFKDLNPENKKARKEPIKPWGVKERLVVLVVLFVTVFTSGILALYARNFKLPQMPKLKIPSVSSLNPFKEEIIVIGNKGSSVSQQKIENIKKIFKETTDNYSGIYAFYIYDIYGDYYYGYNHKEVMQAASLIKLPVMYMAMNQNKDKNLVQAMGKRSDNNAFKTMVSVLGRENINRETLSIGMTKTSLDKNLTTPEDIGIFFKKLYNNELLDESKTKEMEEYMTDTIFEDWLRPGIPEDVVLSHKYGREEHVINDAGIVFSRKPFIMVIMSDGIIESEAEDLIPKLSKLLYDNHTSK